MCSSLNSVYRAGQWAQFSLHSKCYDSWGRKKGQKRGNKENASESELWESTYRDPCRKAHKNIHGIPDAPSSYFLHGLARFPCSVCGFWDQLVCGRGPNNHLNARRAGGGKEESGRKRKPWRGNERGKRRGWGEPNVGKCTCCWTTLRKRSRKVCAAQIPIPAAFVHFLHVALIMPACASCYYDEIFSGEKESQLM